MRALLQYDANLFGACGQNPSVALHLSMEETEAKVSPRIRRELYEFSAIRRITDGRVRLRTVTSSVDATLHDLGTIEEISPLKKKLVQQASVIGALRHLASVYGNVLVDTIGSSACYALVFEKNVLA